MQRFQQLRDKIVKNLRALSSFRRAFVGLSLVGAPCFISAGCTVQAVDALTGAGGAIVWFTLAAMDAALFFWVWDEIPERASLYRRGAMVVFGIITVLFYDLGVKWAVTTANEAALTSESKDQSEGIRDAMQIKMYYALIKQQPLTQSPERIGTTERRPLPRTPPPAPPSFVFVVPGVVLNGNSWDFIVNHRGPQPSFHVEILFVDDMKKEQTTRGKTSLTVDELSSYQIILRYPEIDPRGRGSIYATQFIWTPPVLDHERYAVDITWRERRVHQKLQIERVEGKWLWATQVTDGESGKLLVDCKDIGFPYGPPKSKACFPEMLQPGD